MAGALGAVAVVRRDKPLHAYGRVATGTLIIGTVTAGTPTTGGGPDEPSGIPLLDQLGAHRCTVRASRAMSLAHHGPDVMGVAVRVEGAGADGGDADLLFASTGTGPVTRWLLTLHRSEQGGPLTTLLPQDSSRGARWLRLDPAGRAAYELSWAGAAGRWHPAARLQLDHAWGADQGLRFTPVERPLAGLRPPAWVRVLRRPAYQVARHLTNPQPHEGDPHD
ncbi:hypothetical protein ADJ73_01475 [Arsenicicoccus sp. oral taxon 190]|nr:hypothetical protein ADJ73_01475 [Arsenicicoccus sp. oral taxon 190]